MVYCPVWNVHPKGDSTGVKNCSVFEATRDSQFYQICFVVRHLKYKSTSACLPPRIFGKLGCCIIRVYIPPWSGYLFPGFKAHSSQTERGNAIRPAVETLQKANRSCGSRSHRGTPSENDLRQPCSFLGLRSMGNPRLRSAAEENGGGSPMLRRPQENKGREHVGRRGSPV